MNKSQNAMISSIDFEPLINLVEDGLNSQHSKRAYRKAISEFLTWWVENQKPPLVKATIQRYKTVLQDRELAPSTVNLRISAIRKMAQEAADNGFIPQETANGIGKVKGVTSSGIRTGNWLTKEQAQTLLNSPDTSTIKGLRDRAIVALMIGAGLRRSEVAELSFDQLQQREGRWVIVDLVGKRNRVRTVPIPSWTKQAIDEWTTAAGLIEGKVFRGVYHYGKSLQTESEGISPQAVFYAVQDVVSKTDLDVSPHDLRRTFAKLARKGGAELTQIQLTLGHSNVAITQRYVGEDQNLTDAPCDRLGLDLEKDK